MGRILCQYMKGKQALDNFKKREIRKETKEENKILTQKCIMLY